MFVRLKSLMSGSKVSTYNEDARAINRARRLAIYSEELGQPDLIFPPTGPDEAEILAFERDFGVLSGGGYVLLTSGMSDRSMTMPADAGEDAKPRAELMWYVREPTPEIVGTLRWLASYPFIDDTWLGLGHRIPMPEPVLKGGTFRTFLFLTPVLRPDERMAEGFVVENDPVEILVVHLISDAEYALIKTEGLDPFLNLLDENDHPPILDPDRASYV